MHILLVKMSSMGDVLHTLPALTDAQNAIPELKVDWVLEPAFADISAWHPSVANTIALPLDNGEKIYVKHFIVATFQILNDKFKVKSMMPLLMPKVY